MSGNDSETCDWDGALNTLLSERNGDDAPYEVDWSDPAAIRLERDKVADALLPAFQETIQGVTSMYADAPAIARLAIIGGIMEAVETLGGFLAPAILARTPVDETRVREALHLNADEYATLIGRVERARTLLDEARDCGCGDLHACETDDGSLLFAIVTDGQTGFALTPWWQADEEEGE